MNRGSKREEVKSIAKPLAALTVGAGMTLTGLAISPGAAAPADGGLWSCDNPETFATSNSNWISRSFVAADGSYNDHGPAEWIETDGSPAAGSVMVEDEDNQWQELATPDLTSGGYVTDYSGLAGTDLTFAYKYENDETPDALVTNNVYVDIEGANGKHIYFIFKDQVDFDHEWNTVTVPMTAAQWLTGFTYDDGPQGPAPTEAEFADVLKNVKRFAFSMEGSNNTGDKTYFDTFRPCQTAVDAPDPVEDSAEDSVVPKAPSVPSGGSGVISSDSSEAVLLGGLGLAILTGTVGFVLIGRGSANV